MRPRITAAAWGQMAPAIARRWQDLSEREVLRAQQGQGELGQVIKAHYLLTPPEVDAQIAAFINAHARQRQQRN